MKSNNSKTILAVLTGALAGAALGVFFATRKGSELKEKVSKKAKGAVEAADKKVKSAKETANELKEKIQKATHHNHSNNGHDKSKSKQHA